MNKQISNQIFKSAQLNFTFYTDDNLIFKLGKMTCLYIFVREEIQMTHEKMLKRCQRNENCNHNRCSVRTITVAKILKPKHTEC